VKLAEPIVEKAPTPAPAPVRLAEPVVEKAPTPAPAPVKLVEPVVGQHETKPEVPVAKAAVSEPTSTVELTTQPARPAPVPEAADTEAEVEVEEGVAEVDLEGLDEETGEVSLSNSVADLDAIAGVGEDEEPPSSSQRTLMSAAPREELTFGEGAEAKTPHPAPPESGRQAAIQPASDDLLQSGVRQAPPMVAKIAEPPVAEPPPAAELKLEADVTRPVIAAASPAVFRGALPVAPPATFGALLEATLGL
jgi:hypothetical protein